MEPVISALTEKYRGKVSFLIIDVEKQDDASVEELAEKFKIQYIPTIILIDSRGEMAKQHVGAVSEEDLIMEIDQLIK